jgi:hypothetical protein
MESAHDSKATCEEKIPPARGWCRTSLELLAYYESKLLSHLSVPFKSYPVSLQTDQPNLKSVCNEHINTLEICPDNKNSESKPTLVVIHGIYVCRAIFLSRAFRLTPRLATAALPGNRTQASPPALASLSTLTLR